ncbi:MAG: type II toxin-antitoxin system PemK/MazF family toxin [Anaerococcus sp.]|nr:type II toxin-antitoxin system PemK/MazF family toxin [Peptoniphilaceae bacterium]MDY2918617.1 type II toxin-antitoxin system PemK/MazF family toxin [Anaerococcus sp.]
MVDFKKEDNRNEFINFKNETLNNIKQYLESSLSDNQKRCASIVYWLNDYIKYLKFENRFSASYLPIYKYGSVIDVNLGFNVGDEFGGKHYCVVLNKNDNKKNKLLTVVPLSSLKENKTIKDLNKSEVYLGSSLYDLLTMKYKTEINTYKKMIEELYADKNIDINNLERGINKTEKRLNKIKHLKKGSYARCSQITTISKMRIFDPKNNEDGLIDINLPKENMIKISKTIQKLFLEKF